MKSRVLPAADGPGDCDAFNLGGGHRLRTLAIVSLGLALAVAAVGSIGSPLPRVFPVLLLGFTMIGAEHRDRLFGDETSVSGSIAVAMATIFVFAHGAWLSGPMICAALAGCYWPHLKARAWSRVAINASAMSLAAGAAAIVLHLLPITDIYSIGFVTTVVGSICAFWMANSVVLAVAVATIQQRPIPSVVRHLIVSDLGLLPFAFLGLLSGYVATRNGIIDGWLLLVAVLALLDVLVIRGVGRTSAVPLIGASVTIAALAIAMVLAMTSEPSSTVVIPLLSASGLIAFAAADEVRPDLELGIELAIVVTAAIALQGTQPILGPLIVGVATCLPGLARCRTTIQMVRLALAATATSLAIGATVLLYQPHLAGSIAHCVSYGLAGGAVGLVAWHAAHVLLIAVEAHPHPYRSALDVLVADAPIALLCGSIGGIAGWGTSVGGMRNIAVALAITATILAFVAAATTRRRRGSLLSDEDVLDVVRSAVLDLPASRLAGEAQDRSGSVR